ncbi:ImmA/IrrE family metallo-endopeptidase [Rhizobium brockwellii]|uniref:ImmA/IrrE family metallo-endopeptidase n=1 Tax=Rhizobium brockwellii TaxID=3019932 RepID=A0ABU3YY48_9HYPH|nr:ImmA/IrrE family metallo-endopeptidase [Rhizobium brockwellii]MDV4183793.1 ImmA/IrrE family metallo-endopeptidase [Rhizobium brockwellii]MDV4190781.1 ImmA/IrrE family metallo-endopeptidase [Rhizobium brockwellii]
MSAKIAEAIEAARKVLSDHGIKSAPVPVDRIIKAKGIALEYAPLEPELSGMAYIKDGIAIIGLNSLHHPNRQRFSAAHELGHHELHADILSSAVHVDRGFQVLLRDDVSSLGISDKEREANAFAAELLMPSEFIAGALEKNGLDIEDDEGVAALAKKFKVSTVAMRYRLSNR